MKIKTNCNYCKTRNSLLSIFTRDYYQKEKIWTHTDKTAYYICKKCGFHDEFSLNRIISNAGQFWAYFVADQDIKSVMKLDNKQKRTCVYCEQTTKPPLPDKNEIFHPAITKLYLKKPKKRFLGYFCAVCRRAYYLPLKPIKLEKSTFFKKGNLEDLLNPLNAQLPESLRVTHPKYDKQTKLIQDKRRLDCIGGFTTTKGISFGNPDHTITTISIPKKKYEKIIRLLKKSNCEIVR